MPVIACPHCGTNLNAPESVLGREVVCGQCKQRFVAAAVGQTPGPPQAPQQPTPGTADNAAQSGLGPMEYATSHPGGAEPQTPAPQAGGQGQPLPPPAAPGGYTPPPPPPYGPQMQYGQYPGIPLPPSGGATASLVLGIISIVTACCAMAGVVCGIIAIILGSIAIKKIDAGQNDPNDRGKANAGRICGIIGLILGIVSFFIGLAWNFSGTRFGGSMF